MKAFFEEMAICGRGKSLSQIMRTAFSRHSILGVQNLDRNRMHVLHIGQIGALWNAVFLGDDQYFRRGSRNGGLRHVFGRRAGMVAQVAIANIRTHFSRQRTPD